MGQCPDIEKGEIAMKKLAAVILALCLTLGMCLGAASAEELPRFRMLIA